MKVVTKLLYHYVFIIDKIQKKEIYPYATKQLQHLLRDMRRHLSEKVTLSKQDYIEYLPKMSRTGNPNPSIIEEH